MKKKRAGKNMEKDNNEREHEEIKPNCCNTILLQPALYLEIKFSMYHYVLM